MDELCNNKLTEHWMRRSDTWPCIGTAVAGHLQDRGSQSNTGAGVDSDSRYLVRKAQEEMKHCTSAKFKLQLQDRTKQPRMHAV